MKMRGARAAFTLIELLVVIAIIAVLMGLLMPAVQRVRESANRIKCANNLRQIGIACQTYHDANGHLPSGYLASRRYVDGATDTAPGWGWGTLILPYIEQDPVFKSLDLGQPMTSPHNVAGVQSMIPIYLCPSDLTPGGPFPVPDGFGATIALAGPTSYAACVGGDESATTDATGEGIFYRNSRTRMTDITDGTSSTILIGERAWANANGIWAGAVPGGVIKRGQYNSCQPVVSGAWYPAATLVLAHAHLNNALRDPDGSAGMDDFSSRHFAGSNFVFADGSVHFLRSVAGDNADGSYTNDGLIFQALATRANGEAIAGDWDY
jgi:prepilin-type N-terminal cleavage/methylation domain-containing protein/prepilin-type processing-associated H-X9-DG protein